MSSPVFKAVLVAVVAVAVAVRIRQRRRANASAAPTSAVDRGLRISAILPGVIGLVAEREVRQRMRGRVFRVATILLLLGVAAAILIPAATKGKSRPQHVGVVGVESASVRNAITAVGAALNTTATVTVESDSAMAARAVRSGTADLAVDGNRLIVKHSLTSRDTSKTAQFARTLAQVLGVTEAFRAAGLSPSQAAAVTNARPLPIDGLEARHINTATQATSTIGLIVLFILLTQYLTWTLVGVMEEKSSRVVEVLLSTVRPLQLLAGKVIGIAIVVFAQAILVGAVALGLGRAVGSDVLKGSAPLVLLSSVLWLLLGYAFYCWLYAAAGSMAERQDQVQSLAIPLALPMIASYILCVSAVSAGGGAPGFIKVLAYIPPTAPFAMTALVGLGAVSWWQFTLSALITAASVVGVARFAAAVYRRAILRTGRRVKVRELFGERSTA